MKTLGIIMICFALCVGLTACGDMFSPEVSVTQAGRDVTAPEDDVHENLGPGESCGTAAERSGCHDRTIIVNEVKAWVAALGYIYD